MPPDAEQLTYESNPKHKLPWQPGRKGTLCPKWSHREAAEMLQQSVLDGKHRYATMNGVAFRAQEHRPGLWHGYPIGWKDVPPRIRKLWKNNKSITIKQIKASLEEALLSADE